MKDSTQGALDDPKYQEAKARIEAKRRARTGEAGGVMVAAFAYGNALEESALLARATHWARLICIAAVCVIPNLLVIRVLL
jgi:hypothetical protein